MLDPVLKTVIANEGVEELKTAGVHPAAKVDPSVLKEIAEIHPEDEVDELKTFIVMDSPTPT